MTTRRPPTDAADLIGFTVRSRFTGTVFVVTRTDERRGRRAVAGDGCWAALEAVTVIAPPGDDALR